MQKTRDNILASGCNMKFNIKLCEYFSLIIIIKV